jgi:hypothetical protein
VKKYRSVAGELGQIPWPLRPLLGFGYVWGVLLRIALLGLGVALVIVGNTAARAIGIALVVGWFGVAAWYAAAGRRESGR